ncbi:putative uncharacterized protein [Clostridium sp. CAG:389]|nr:putative uncharacterized protein [Clostridium sp. CAG:389]
MIRYTKRYVNIVSLIITIIIFSFTNQISITPNKININSISNLFKRNLVLVELNSNNINQETKENIPLVKNQNNNDEQIINEIQEKIKNVNWKITIPKISLEAEISEGTRKEVMDKFVGHFEETTKTSGNVGLAAHNRGYPVNYFADIKKLKEGDEIIYKYFEFEKTYLVTENKIIADIDWEPLENTKENKITLITCVENEPEYRRCIQAIEKEN